MSKKTGKMLDVEYCEPCRESKKTIKKRLKVAKKTLRDAYNLFNHVEISYDTVNQSLGSLYRNVATLEDQLKNY